MSKISPHSNKIDIDSLIRLVSKEVGRELKDAKTPNSGLDSIVLEVSDSCGNEFVIKVGQNCNYDILAYNIIGSAKLGIPIPRRILTTKFNQYPVLIMEKLKGYPLREVILKDFREYLPSIIETYKNVHRIKSDFCGDLINIENKSVEWKDFHLSKFYRSYWSEILQRKILNKDLILESLERYITEFNRLYVNQNCQFSLLHNDCNQENIFVDISEKKVTGIIDWSYAIWGDPIYDFSRLRLMFLHFDIEENVLENYFEIMQYSEYEKDLEHLYFISRIIEYLEYYSRNSDILSSERIKLHQNILRFFIK